MASLYVYNATVHRHRVENWTLQNCRHWCWAWVTRGSGERGPAFFEESCSKSLCTGLISLLSFQLLASSSWLHFNVSLLLVGFRWQREEILIGEDFTEHVPLQEQTHPSPWDQSRPTQPNGDWSKPTQPVGPEQTHPASWGLEQTDPACVTRSAAAWLSKDGCCHLVHKPDR